MTRDQRDSVLEIAPRKLRNTFTLSEAACLTSKRDAQTISELAALRGRLVAEDFPDIPDPIGKGPAVFETVGAQIADHLSVVLELCRRSCDSLAD